MLHYHYAPSQVHFHLSEKQLLNLLLDGGNLRLDLRTLVLGHASSDDRPANPTCSAQSLLGPDEHVGHVLVLAQQGDVEKNLQRLTVSCEDDKLGLTPVEGLSGLVGTLPQLLVIRSLLDQIENLGREGLLCQGVGFWVHLVSHVEDVRVIGGGD